jgi:hypothetical protein
MHCSNGYSHKRENVFLEKLKKKYSNVFYLTFTRLSFNPFLPKPPLFLFSAHQSHHLLPPFSSPALSHRRQASWPALHGTAEAARPCGPARAPEIFCGPTKSCATPLNLQQAQLAPRRAPADTSKVALPPVLPLVLPSLWLKPRPPFPPLAPIKAPLEAPKLVAPNLQLQRVSIYAWTHHSTPTLYKPTIPPPSPPEPVATQPFPTPSSSLDRRPHHPHPLSALCHHQQAVSVHPFLT